MAITLLNFGHLRERKKFQKEKQIEEACHFTLRKKATEPETTGKNVNLKLNSIEIVVKGRDIYQAYVRKT